MGWKLRMAFAVLLAPAAFPSLATCPTPRLEQGMRYARARPIILAMGFSAQRGQAAAPCPRAANCEAYPELRSCSREDYCQMRFKDGRGDELDVFVYGDIESGLGDVEDFRILCRVPAQQQKLR